MPSIGGVASSGSALISTLRAAVFTRREFRRSEATRTV